MTLIPPPRQLPPLPRKAPRRASAAFISHLAYAIALGFGSGLSPFAPGTVGTLWARCPSPCSCLA